MTFTKKLSALAIAGHYGYYRSLYSDSSGCGC